MKEVCVYVSTHKKYFFPNNEVYIPVQVGLDEGVEPLGYTGDNTGDNISYKHKYYSDLSTVYWAWKNSNADIIGVCHYRRYFVSTSKKDKNNKLKYVLSKIEIEELIEKYKIIVPKKRRYYIESIESHFKHTHTSCDFDYLREVVKNETPEYFDSFEEVSKSTSAHLFNCFIMNSKDYNDYCTFLFKVLFKVEAKIDFSNRSEFESRTCGYLAEFLLDTWLLKNKKMFVECKLEVIDGEKKFRKALAFLAAKFLKKKYKKSF